MKTEDWSLEAVSPGALTHSRYYFDVFFTVQYIINHFVENDLLEETQARVKVRAKVEYEGRDGGRRAHPSIRGDGASVGGLLPHQHRPDVEELLQNTHARGRERV